MLRASGREDWLMCQDCRGGNPGAGLFRLRPPQ